MPEWVPLVRALAWQMNVLGHDDQGSGSVIYETGCGRTTRSQGKPPFKFKYVNVWVRGPDGSYKLDVDFYNGLP